MFWTFLKVPAVLPFHPSRYLYVLDPAHVFLSSGDQFAQVNEKIYSITTTTQRKSNRKDISAAVPIHNGRHPADQICICVE
jgi:hypothetical protein